MVDADIKKTTWLIRWFKWIIVLFSCIFLVYKLLSFNNYELFIESFRNVNALQFAALLSALFLLPLNLLLESKKWQVLLANVQTLSVKESFLSVLAGFSSASFTPNRIGEFIGRSMFVLPENRKFIAFYSVLNGLTQNLIIALTGIPALVYLLFTGQSFFFAAGYQHLIVMVFFVLSTIALFTMRDRILNFRIINRYFPFLAQIKEHNSINWKMVFGITLARFILFSLQFYFVLFFFHVNITAFTAIIVIPSTYLLVTFMPSFAFTEAAVRSSFAVLIIGIFHSNIVGIAFAGFLTWLINFAVPMLVGTKILAGKK